MVYLEAGCGCHMPVGKPLSDGSLVRTYASPSQVYQVALSAPAVAWSETANGLTDGPTPNWRVTRLIRPLRLSHPSAALGGRAAGGIGVVEGRRARARRRPA